MVCRLTQEGESLIGLLAAGFLPGVRILLEHYDGYALVGSLDGDQLHLFKLPVIEPAFNPGTVS